MSGSNGHHAAPIKASCTGKVLVFLGLACLAGAIMETCEGPPEDAVTPATKAAWEQQARRLCEDTTGIPVVSIQDIGAPRYHVIHRNDAWQASCYVYFGKVQYWSKRRRTHR